MNRHHPTAPRPPKFFGPKAELAARYAAMIALLALFIGPFVWMTLIALQEGGAAMDISLRPADMTLENFAAVWKNYAIGRAFLNSVLVALAVVALNVVICSLAAYPLARMDFPGNKLIFLLILSTLMLPVQLYMIPLYELALALRLDDTLTAVVLPAAAGALGIYIIRQYYATIPRDLEEAARIDGANEFAIWFRVMLPLTKPAVAAMAIFVFVQNWSNFLWPLIVLKSQEKYTLPLALFELEGVFEANTRYIYAGSFIAIAPILLFFLFFQRWFLGGLSMGAVKG
ncbi:MAG: carbohydrate ABC transporter permease [Sumerlaeia bacterium]